MKSVYVVRERRNHGIGTALVQAVIDAAKEQHLEYLSLHAAEAAMPLYRRLGFSAGRNALELILLET